jgi:phosphatidylserine/phosphatidylglycerophosphate/cardiolipin synthase-like enzyme
MQSGVQLYSYWKSRIEEMGRIRTAWFTTFNLDIGFFEKYILSALTGMDARDMSRPEDYEAISNAFNDNSTDEHLDVRVFYDARALLNSGKPKLTTVDLHAIDPELLDKRFTGGVFHPKVALIENDRGQFWLLTGSFNMTLSGWARNRESFFLELIEDAENALELHTFFSQLASICNLESRTALQRLRKVKTTSETSWKFRSSLNSGFWLDDLRKGNQREDLRIWSPYFSENLNDVVKSLNKLGWSHIEVIPATNESQKIRIEAENYTAAKNHVHFLRDDVMGVDPDVFVHAKVWLTSNTIAIGSWNMTQAGMNLSAGAANNIEAGVIVELSSDERQAIEKSVRLSKLDNPVFCDAHEIKDDEQSQLKAGAFVVDLVLDWEQRHIRLVSPDFHALRARLKTDGFLSIAGLGQLPVARWTHPQSIRSHELRLLTDRYFTVKDEGGETVYQGYMRERGLSFRPVNGYQNLNDCMMSWFTETPERHSEWQVVNYSGEVIEGIQIERFTGAETHNYQGWFNTFYALECIKKSITEARKNEDRVIRLRKIGRVIPGNILEIKKHLLVEQDQLGNTFSENGIYLGFVISKFNAIIEYYNRAVKTEEECIEPLPYQEKEFKELLQSKYNYTPRQINQWTSFVHERLNS